MTGPKSARPARIALAGLALAAAAVLAAAWSIPGRPVLRAIPLNGTSPLLELPLEPGERFTLRYWHSVDKTPIWEEHSVDAAGGIFIEEERLVMFGAGMGELPGRGRLTGRGPHQVIEGMHWPLGNSFVLRVGSPGVDHTILWRDRAVNLSALVPGQAVEISAPVLGWPAWLWRGWRPLLPCSNRE